MSTLNAQQTEAVKLIDETCLVLAGAGCGKTLVIIEKLRSLIEEHRFDPYRVAALTFTNKAALEMGQRLKTRVNNSQLTKGLTISTFHSLGLQILKCSHAAANLHASFTLLDNSDCLAILKDMLTQQSSTISDSKLIKIQRHYISQQKNANLSPQQALEIAETDEEYQLAKTYQSYQQRLNQFSSVDFDDLLRIPVQLLEHDEATQQQWSQRFRHILIDEYQDTNDCQYDLIRLLKNDHCQLTAVGDDSQSIYTWRGAKPENMLRILREFKPSKVIPLEQNFRSTNTILKAANAVIANNPQQLSKQLWSNLGDGEAIQLIKAVNPDDEAQQIIQKIQVERICKQRSLNDFCILFRSHHNAEPFERALRQERLDYKISGGMSLFDRVEIKNLVAYLKLMANPLDDAAFLRIINTPRREIGAVTIAKLSALANQYQLSLLQVCRSQGIKGAFNHATAKRLGDFAEWVERMARTAEHNVLMALEQMIIDINYLDWIHATANKPQVAEKQVLRIADFQHWIDQLVKEKKFQI